MGDIIYKELSFEVDFKEYNGYKLVKGREIEF